MKTSVSGGTCLVLRSWTWSTLSWTRWARSPSRMTSWMKSSTMNPSQLPAPPGSQPLSPPKHRCQGFLPCKKQSCSFRCRLIFSPFYAILTQIQTQALSWTQAIFSLNARFRKFWSCSFQLFSNNSRRDITRTLFGLGFFAFPNFSWKTTPSVKKSLQKGHFKGQLKG